MNNPYMSGVERTAYALGYKAGKRNNGAEPEATGSSDSENTHKYSACTECSRLASRVEELREGVENLMYWNRTTMEICDKMMADRHITPENIFTGAEPKINWDLHREFLEAANKQADKLLAGAHAEEKE